MVTLSARETHSSYYAVLASPSMQSTQRVSHDVRGHQSFSVMATCHHTRDGCQSYVSDLDFLRSSHSLLVTSPHTCNRLLMSTWSNSNFWSLLEPFPAAAVSFSIRWGGASFSCSWLKAWCMCDFSVPNLSSSCRYLRLYYVWALCTNQGGFISPFCCRTELFSVSGLQWTK